MSRPSLRNSIRLGDPYPELSKRDTSAQDPVDIRSLALPLLFQRFDQSRLMQCLRNRSRDIPRDYASIANEPAYKTWIRPAGHDPRTVLEGGGLAGPPSSSDRDFRLCISGASESTQSLLTLLIVDELQRLQSQSTDRIQILYFFCDPRDRSANNPTAMLKAWIFQMTQQRPELMKDFSEWLVEPYYLFMYHDKLLTLWSELRAAVKAENAGTTYCIIVGMQEWAEEHVQKVTDLFEQRFPLEGCLENESKLRVLIIGREPTKSDKFAHINYSAHLEEGQRTDIMDVERMPIHEFVEATCAPHHLSCSETLEILGTFRNPPSLEQLAWAIDEPKEALKQRVALLHSFVELREDTGRINFLLVSVCGKLSLTPTRPDIHLKLAKQCLNVISQEFAQVDFRMLGILVDGRHACISPNLQYAALFWAEHIKLSQNSSDDLLDLVLATFSQDSTVIDKWWIVYLHEVCHMNEPIRHGHHTTVLHILAYLGLHGLLQRALNSDRWPKLQEFIDAQDCNDKSPLTLALLQNQHEAARLLIAGGAELKHHHLDAAVMADAELAHFALNHYTGEPLSHEQRLELLNVVVEVGASEEVVARIIEFLKANGEQGVFPWGETNAITHAIDDGFEGIVKQLLTITDIGSAAEDLIQKAVRIHDEVQLVMLLKHPAIRSFIIEHKFTLQSSLNMAIERRCPLMVDALMTEINVDMKDYEGYSPLQVATRFPNMQTLCRFLHVPTFRCGGQSVEEGVALNLLIHQDRLDIPCPLLNLREMLERGARMRYEHFGITAFHVAAESGRTEVMEVLLAKLSKEEIKADINLQPSSRHSPQWDDTTALAIAAMKGYVDIVKLLVLHGADLRIKDRNGRAPMQLAQEQGYTEIVETLEIVEKEGIASFTKSQKGNAGGSAKSRGRKGKKGR